MADLYAEYLRRNLEVAKAVGINANALTALERVRKMKRPPKWLIDALGGIVDRSVGLPAELAQWRNLAPDAPEYARTAGVQEVPRG